MKRLFGTDGIRGEAGAPPLDPVTVRRFGAALGHILGEALGRPPGVVLGRDTRESGEWLRHAVAAGLAHSGGRGVDAGVLTTPGLAYVTHTGPFDAGVMISASHNPYHDNGLKVFGSDGVKLSDELERRIEAEILDAGHPDPGADDDALQQDPALADGYVRFLETVLSPGALTGVRLVLDCANGAAFEIAPRVFRRYGAEVIVLGASPDGRNINLDCGSLHLDAVARRVAEEDCLMGLAFDGDADRCLAADHRGREVNGDYILYLTARMLRSEGALRGDKVVATVMSNFWLEQQLDREGIELLRAPVGDKYVLERMVAENAVLGGEQSGHIIFRDRSTTGDGVLTGLLLVKTVLDQQESLEGTLDRITPCPQLLLNVRVREKPDLRAHETIGPAVADVERELDGSGRVVLRYSGTEPVARVMVEGTDEQAVRGHAERLALLIEQQLG